MLSVYSQSIVNIKSAVARRRMTRIFYSGCVRILELTVVALFQGSARESIEELRSSMSELKLPAEMDFKYK